MVLIFNGFVVVGARGSAINQHLGHENATAASAIFYGPNDKKNRSRLVYTKQSNNNAELVASIFALRDAVYKGYQKLIIVTNSQYVISYAANCDYYGASKSRKRKDRDCPNLCTLNTFRRYKRLLEDRGGMVFWVHPTDPHLKDNTPYPHLRRVLEYDIRLKREQLDEIRQYFQWWNDQAYEMAHTLSSNVAHTRFTKYTF